MKKVVILLAAAALAVSLGACEGDVAAERTEETEQEVATGSEESAESEEAMESMESESETESMEETAETEIGEEMADGGREENTAASAADVEEAPAADAGVLAEENAAEPAADTGATAEENAEPTADAGVAAGNVMAPAADTGDAAGNSAAPAVAGGSLLETAKSFEGASLDALIQAIGQPISSDYAPSCLGEGEDGNLYYDGFTVYTYRDGTGEVVSYVE